MLSMWDDREERLKELSVAGGLRKRLNAYE